MEKFIPAAIAISFIVGVGVTAHFLFGRRRRANHGVPPPSQGSAMEEHTAGHEDHGGRDTWKSNFKALKKLLTGKQSLSYDRSTSGMFQWCRSKPPGERWFCYSVLVAGLALGVAFGVFAMLEQYEASMTHDLGSRGETTHSFDPPRSPTISP